MTIQGSSPVAATTMTTPDTLLLLRSIFLRGFAHSTTVCHLLILAFIFALVESATTATRLLMFFSFFLFFSFILRTFLILYFVSFLWAFDFNNSQSSLEDLSHLV